MTCQGILLEESSNVIFQITNKELSCHETLCTPPWNPRSSEYSEPLDQIVTKLKVCYK